MSFDKRGKNTELGDLVAQHRKAQGRSARDVARQAGIDIHTMTNWSRVTTPTRARNTLRGVSTALDVPLLELFRAAGYVTPYDLIDLVTHPAVEPVLVEREAIEARSRYIEQLIDKHGLDYTGPEYTDTLIDH